jgi:hypothetical protein
MGNFDVTSSVLGEVLARLDLVVFERLPEGVFWRIAREQPPAWFSRLFPEAAQSEPGTTISQAFPFLEPFLSAAEDVWREGSEQRLRSDAFPVTDTSGGEIALVASAVAIDDRCFLILELSYDFEERRRTLQSARQHVLAHEEHVRRTGALLTPVDAADQLARQLSESGLTPDQQHLATRIREQLASLAGSIETLAPLPRGVSRRSRH